MKKPKQTWQFYSSRRRGLSVEKYIETNKIRSLDELRENLRQKDIQLPPPELLEGLFKPTWTGKYSDSKSSTQEEKAQPVKTKRGVANDKSRKTAPRKKKPKASPEKKSTYLQAAYETGKQDDDPDAASGT